MKQHRVAQNCTDVGPGCSVEDTIYGYLPNLGSGIFFVATFALLAVIQLGLGFKKRTYFYSVAIALGCIGEAVGYGGRIMMHSNPYGDMGFKIQISCLIVAPAFVAAGIYLTLKHIILAFGQERSYIQARFYTWIFITCDFISLTLQGIGGGFAGGADDDQKMRDLGTNLMIAGIVQQVATLMAFAYLVTDYAVRTRFAWEAVDPEAKALLTQWKFKGFLAAVFIAFWTVFFRCVYRIAEMVGGWANSHNAMILVAVIVLTVFHPGYCFPQKRAITKVGSIEFVGSDSEAQSGREKISRSAM
ncbi:hypothetical protein VTL71DRAFT_16147 [Oculimacula yallundae]|uniref:Uncharacterized protein n=1 Tax=Oculimacula yallundae TaxID=86028 RepID=A0ABR4CDM3_9HELO